MSDCLDMFKTIIESRSTAFVLVTVARVRGSSPREVGAQMLVSQTSIQGTIGGGNFEFSAIDLAREILSDNDDKAIVQEYPLGPALGQCCGGVVTLLLEPLTKTLIQHFAQSVAISTSGKTAVSIVDIENPTGRMLLAEGIIPVMAPTEIISKGEGLLNNAVEICQTFNAEGDKNYLMQVVRQNKTLLYLYGAGHVGRALVNAILPLHFDIHWVDSRVDEFPENVAKLTLTQHLTNDPVTVAQNSPTGAFHLVLTHDHQVDFDICEALLRRDDYGYLGMIGSDTKRARFVRRLQKRGIENSHLDKFICPIGISEVTSKHPAEIAVSVAVEIIQVQAKIRELAPIVKSENRRNKSGVANS